MGLVVLLVSRMVRAFAHRHCAVVGAHVDPYSVPRKGKRQEQRQRREIAHELHRVKLVKTLHQHKSR